MTKNKLYIIAHYSFGGELIGAKTPVADGNYRATVKFGTVLDKCGKLKNLGVTEVAIADAARALGERLAEQQVYAAYIAVARMMPGFFETAEKYQADMRIILDIPGVKYAAGWEGLFGQPGENGREYFRQFESAKSSRRKAKSVGEVANYLAEKFINRKRRINAELLLNYAAAAAIGVSNSHAKIEIWHSARFEYVQAKADKMLTVKVSKVGKAVRSVCSKRFGSDDEYKEYNPVGNDAAFLIADQEYYFIEPDGNERYMAKALFPFKGAPDGEIIYITSDDLFSTSIGEIDENGVATFQKNYAATANWQVLRQLVTFRASSLARFGNKFSMEEDLSANVSDGELLMVEEDDNDDDASYVSVTADDNENDDVVDF